MSTRDRTKVFISYSHFDQRHLDQLQVHLTPLMREGHVDVWADTRLQAGDDWRKEIRQALDTAKVAIVLVSAPFRASAFIAENELPPLLEAAKNDGLVIIPVVVGACDFRDSELAYIQAINSPMRPLDQLRRVDRDKLWVKVVQRVKDVLANSIETSKAGEDSAQEEWRQSAHGRVFDGARSAILSKAVQLNKEGQYQEALQVLKPLVTADPLDFIAWFEYAYALAQLGQQGTVTDFVSAFMRAYNNSDPRRYALGYNDVKFPAIWRYGVLVGMGLMSCPHGLHTRPDAVYLVMEDGSRNIYGAPDTAPVTGDTAVVNVTAPQHERWIGVAMKHEAP